MSKRLRSAAVVQDSDSRLMRQSQKGVWLFQQTDVLAEGPVRKSYLVDDVRTGIAGGFATTSFKEALADFQRRKDELPS